MSIAFDRLRAGAPLEVLRFEGATIGGPGALSGVREPHRHDYHELLWIRCGEGEHVLDGEIVAVIPGAVTVIGRGQVHQFRWARGLHGAVLRFAADLVDATGRATPQWLLAGRGGRVVPVPAGESATLDGVVDALGAEVARPPDTRTGELERHLLAVALLWIERWYDASQMERPTTAGDGDEQLHRRFTQLLEAQFVHHHDAAHYARALAVPAATLARALGAVTGRSTKELVTDRVMLEATRLLRFTDLSVSEVAHRVGFGDPLYFSRAFKRHCGASPQHFRDAARGG